jgi:hypothetical protein
LKTKQFLSFLIWHFENPFKKLGKKEEKPGKKVVIQFHLFRQHEGGGLVSALENGVPEQSLP